MANLNELLQIIERTLPPEKQHKYRQLSNLPIEEDVAAIHGSWLAEGVLELNDVPGLRSELIELLSTISPAEEEQDSEAVSLDIPSLALILNFINRFPQAERTENSTMEVKINDRTVLVVTEHNRVKMVDLEQERPDVSFTPQQSEFLLTLMKQGGQASYEELEALFTQGRSSKRAQMRVIINHIHHRYAAFLGRKPHKNMLLKANLNEGYLLQASWQAEMERALVENRGQAGVWLTQDIVWNSTSKSLVRVKGNKLAQIVTVMPMEAKLLNLMLASPNREIAIEDLKKIGLSGTRNSEVYDQTVFIQNVRVYMFHLRRALVEVFPKSAKPNPRQVITLESSSDKNPVYRLNLK